MIRRAIVVVGVALVVAGLFRLDDPHPFPTAPDSPVVGAAVVADSDSSTWYCAAAPDGSAEAPEHQVIITNLGGEASARITGYRTDGTVATTDADLAARSQRVVAVTDVGAGVAGVTVEITGGTATVAHRLVGATRSDQSDCLVDTSARWYFASANTEKNLTTERQNSAQLWLLNPFPTDASVDVRVSTEDGVRVPTALDGIIVPARSSRFVELSTAVERRAQFAFTVEATGGRVAAELAQVVDGRGLRLQPGVLAPAPTWTFADSFGGTDLSEQLHVYNPSPDDVEVAVSVVPNGVDPAAFPEPFVLEIPGRRFASIDLGNEARIPPDSLRWIRVDALNGTGVVASHVVAIAGPGGDGTANTRPSVAGGLASSSGSSAQATSWYVTSVDPTTDSQSVVVIANPSEDVIALVDLSAIAGGDVATIAERQEVPPMSSLVVNVSEATANGPIGLKVESTSPVVVSARTTSSSRAEVSLLPAVPVASSATALPDLVGG